MNIQIFHPSHYPSLVALSRGDIVKLLIKIYLQCRSSTKLISLGSTSGVFIAWQVNIEFKSDLCTWGHINRFSVKSPVCCSTCSSTISPFTSHRTCGVGRPVINRNENCVWLGSIENGKFVDFIRKYCTRRSHVYRERLKCVNIHFDFTQSIFHVNIFASLSFDWRFDEKKERFSCCLKIATQPQHVLPQFRIVNSHHYYLHCSEFSLQTVPVAVYMLFDHWHGEY